MSREVAGSASRVREPNLQAADLAYGGEASFRVAFGAPGSAVWLYSGRDAGAGPCRPTLQGGCFGVLAPELEAVGVVEADGTATVRFPVPAVPMGTVRAFQAVVDGAPPSLSNVVVRTVGPSPISPPAGHNVLVVLLDDVGTDKLALYNANQPAPTPNIDALAAAGVVFDNAYTRPVCVPSRAALQTGRYGRRTGVGINWRDDDTWELGLEQITLAEVAEMSPYFSYTTAMLGKWHLGSGTAPSGYAHPNLQGWDHYAGAFANVDDYLQWDKVVDGAAPVPTATYATTDTIDDAIAQIASMPEPWLLVVSLNAAHLPLHEPDAALMPVVPGPGPGLEVRKAVAAVDTELGRLVASFPSGLFRRTTVFLTADNGTYHTQTQPPADNNRAKGTLFDGGVRVPFIAAGAGVRGRGARSAAMIDLVDILPTVAEMAGVDLTTLTSATDGGVPYRIDGISLAPYLRDPTTPSIRRVQYSELFSPPGGGPYLDQDRQAVRDENYKLIVDNLTGMHMFFAFDAEGVEGEDLLRCGTLDAAAQAAYDNLLAEIALRNADLSFDAEPFAPGDGLNGYPLNHDTGACPSDTGP